MLMADWSVKQLSPYTGINGTYFLNGISNISKQTFYGALYQFTMHIKIAVLDGTQIVMKCDVSILDRKWEVSKEFNENPICTKV
ncbi:unnamed protein product [Brachionus calyciflorus]|uniref:Uncharacterized protein n=1 Tax=Brachionus calyciflorus TaxID=104777 RepID=A0A813PWC4_9BILA|nr:unnamed protein product [Brachionus calyciflorus]